MFRRTLVPWPQRGPNRNVTILKCRDEESPKLCDPRLHQEFGPGVVRRVDVELDAGDGDGFGC